MGVLPVRRFLNFSVISSVIGVIGPIRATRLGPRDWRLILMWVGWGISVAIAVGTVIEESRAIESGDEA